MVESSPEYNPPQSFFSTPKNMLSVGVTSNNEILRRDFAKLFLAWSTMDLFIKWSDDKLMLFEDNNGDYIVEIFLLVVVWLLWMMRIRPRRRII